MEQNKESMTEKVRKQKQKKQDTNRESKKAEKQRRKQAKMDENNGSKRFFLNKCNHNIKCVAGIWWFYPFYVNLTMKEAGYAVMCPRDTQVFDTTNPPKWTSLFKQ